MFLTRLDSLGTSSFLDANTPADLLPHHLVATHVTEPRHYDELLARESRHWGEVGRDPENPQIWHDPELFGVFFGKEVGRLLDRAVQSGPRVLELGCGEGRLSLELAARGMHVTGIDLSEERIRKANSHAGSGHHSILPTFMTGDLNTLELPSESYDCVVAHDALHHILHLDHLCRQVKKTLRPGGAFLVMDYIGMGKVRKIFAGALYGILPTYLPYKKKWNLRRRLPAYLATEAEKRTALEGSSSGPLHHESPFEEISQESIVKEIESNFQINDLQTYCPFWYYLAPKIRIPAGWKRPMARMFRSLDDMMVSLRLAEGAYVWIDAQKPPTIP